ncbi:hypothetical protein F0L68_30010 [Solihabitans fulvus]|uniref:Magnesium transporter NIPA n=1 Tax=Solihabitans fulvus TaxID=1892852 RepID=A0A5B2WRW2_9PSEU|nr:hypothetical protein [Solihabitans fulvus]KAA2254421.1 hypothetical protein F0L68_30010 [Solihabitans fulvus]
MSLIGIALAALGAVCYAVAARLQHGAVRTAVGDRALRLGTLRTLVRAPAWLFGLLATGTGATLHAVALGLAPLTVVQPIGVLALGLTALLDARAEGTWPDGRTALAVVASTVGVGGFVLLAAGSAASTTVSGSAQWHAAVLVVCAVAVLALFGALSRGPVRGLVFAAGAGIAYGFVSVLMRGIAQRLAGGGVGAVPVPAVLGIAVALLVGGWLVQHAYASGPSHLTVACLTVVDPLVAVGIGIALLGEGAGTSGWTAVGEVACAVLATAGVSLLAKRRKDISSISPTRRELVASRSNNGGTS